MIFRLDERLLFPDPALAEDDGLLAIDGDLSPQRLMLAYKNGIFPWYNDDSPVLWYSPHERFVLRPGMLKLSKSMRRLMQSGKFNITTNTCFNDVITACAITERAGQHGTWITNDMLAAYNELHRSGYAHSVEVWQQGQLVGGCYGVQVNTIFCGESMFSRVSNASKAALIWLCASGKYQLIDCQIYSEHLASMGAEIVSREEYMHLLHANEL